MMVSLWFNGAVTTIEYQKNPVGQFNFMGGLTLLCITNWHGPLYLLQYATISDLSFLKYYLLSK